MNKSEITAAGFAAIRRSPRRLITNIQGMTKSGKTRLALTARKPIGYIAVEIGGDEGVVDHFIPAGSESSEDIQRVRIRVPNIEYPVDITDSKKYDEAISAEVQRTASEALDAFYAAYYASIANFATTVVDTGSDLWEIARLANFGRLEKVPQLAYTQLNKSMDKMIDDAFSAPGSVLFVHHLKEKWETYEDERGRKQGRPSGIFEMAGYGGMKKKVQTTIELWREDLADPNENTGRLTRFHGMIVDSRHNADAIGLKFEDDGLTFPEMGTAIIAGTRKSDWE